MWQISPLENDLSTKPISIDEAKTWFQQQQVGSPNANPTDDSLLIIPVANPDWDSAFNSLNPQNRDYVIAPLDLSGDSGRIRTKLLVTRDSAGLPMGIFLTYCADEFYHTRTNGNYNTHDFSGKVIYSGLDGRFLYGFEVNNGQRSYPIEAKKQDTNTSQIRKSDNTASLRGCVGSVTVWNHCQEMIVLGPIECFLISIRTYCPRLLPSFSGGNDVWVGGSSWGNGQPTVLFTATQLLQVQKTFRDNGLFDLYETLQSNQAELRLVYNFLKLNSTNQANITLFKKYLDKGFSYPEFDRVRTNPSLFTKSEAFFNTFGSRSDFNQRVSAAMTPDFNPTGLEITEEERVKRYEAFIDITNDFKTQLTQQTDVSITSGGDMNLLMRIFGKVLGKKIGRVIPFVGSAISAEAAWSAYNLGNYGEAAFELAGIAMDFIPAGIVLETGYTVVGVAYDAFKAYKPIVKLSSLCTGSFAHVFTGLFNVIDDFNLFDKLDDVTRGNSVTNISMKLSQVGKSVDDFLQILASKLGTTWQPHPSGAGFIMDLGGNSNLFFYPARSSTGNPGIQFTFNGIIVLKIDLQ